MKKFIKYLCRVLLCAALITVIGAVFPKEKTVDYCGIVKSVEYNEQDKCTYIDTYMIYYESSSVIIKAKPKISVKYVSGEKCALGDIKAGDMIDLDYRGEIDGYGSVVTAKWIKVAPREDVNVGKENQ